MIVKSASIPSSYSRLIARILNLNERNLNPLLRFTNISKKQFLKEELIITAQQQIQILQNALLLSGTKSFGLEFGKNLTPPTNILGTLMCSLHPCRCMGGGKDAQALWLWCLTYAP